MLNRVGVATAAAAAARARLFSTREFLQRLDGEILDPAVAQANRAALADDQLGDAAKCVDNPLLGTDFAPCLTISAPPGTARVFPAGAQVQNGGGWLHAARLLCK